MSNNLHRRCEWAEKDPLYIRYHDEEWGVPIHDDKSIFEFLVLEGAQAGLSWLTVLRRREGYRNAFCNFDPEKVAVYGKSEIRRLLNDEGIIRNRLKIEATIENAKRFLEVKKEFGSFDKYLWNFVDYRVKINKWKRIEQIPSSSRESDAMSKDMKKRGFRFVGSTICYAHMQASGMINDHLTCCFRYPELGGTL